MTGEPVSGGGAVRRAWMRMGALALVVLALDQVTKVVIRETVERGDAVQVLLGFELVNVRNRGIAFGLFDDGGALLLVLTALTLAFLVAWFATEPTRHGLWLAIGLLVGGAVGNLADRVRAGEVTDFLDLPGWPAFNVADVGITGGVLILVLIALSGGREAGPEP